MSLNRYTRKNGFTIGNQDFPEFADAYDGDKITIDERVGNHVTFRYFTYQGSYYRKSWDTALGVYDETTDIITGDIMIQPMDGKGDAIQGKFSIALDRRREYQQPDAFIHVHVWVPGGAPDEGSFTGQGN